MTLKTELRKAAGLKSWNTRRSQLHFTFLTQERNLLPTQYYETATKVAWLHTTGRLGADADMALRDMNCWKFCELIEVIFKDLSGSEYNRSTTDLAYYLNYRFGGK